MLSGVHVSVSSASLSSTVYFARVALPCSLCSQVSLLYLHMQADLAHRNRQVEQLSHKVADHNEAMSKLRADLDSGVARKTGLESSLDRTTKEKSHWQQKSVQQDMVIQTTRQVIISFCAANAVFLTFSKLQKL